MVKVKICGITHEDDAMWAAGLGADFVGFNFWKESPRHVSPKKAKEIRAKLPSFVRAAGVFVNHPLKEIESCVREVGLALIQLHGQESAEDIMALRETLNDLGSAVKIVKALKIAAIEHLDEAKPYMGVCDYYLLDYRDEQLLGGTGKSFSWDLALEFKKIITTPFFLAGGLTPENVKQAVQKTQPFSVDVASGVEKTPRRKDYEKLKRFITEAKGLSKQQKKVI